VRTDRISVVIMNWARSANVIRFVKQYHGCHNIGEIIVWDASVASPLPPGVFDDLKDKVHYVRSHHDFGLYPRYMMGAAAEGNSVMIVDDDLLLPASTIDALHDYHKKDPLTIHGLIGRQPTLDGNYTPHLVVGPCEIVLTRALITSPWLCGRAVAWGTKHIRELPGVPTGNGEDIVLSYTAMAESGRLNRTYKLAYSNEDRGNPQAISTRFKAHGQHRSAVVKWCRRYIMDGRQTPVLK